MSRAPATRGRRRGAPSTARNAAALMTSCWLLPTVERRPRDSICGRTDSIVLRSTPFFSSLERTPSSA
eukprot:6903946-Ditylum_brightwellii.AAC.1